MISKELSATLGFAVREAKKRRHEYVCIEHVLFAILHDPAGIDIIENCGGDVDNLKTDLEGYFTDKMESVPEDDEFVLQQTIGFQRMIQRAVNHVRSAEKAEVSIGDILASMFKEKDSHAVYFLKNQGITRLDVLNYISHEVSKLPFHQDQGGFARTSREEKKKKTDPLEAVSYTHLTLPTIYSV